MKTILVPLDYSANSNAACKYAISIAKITKAKIILLHVFETPLIYADVTLTTAQMNYSLIHDAAAQKLKKYLNTIKKTSGTVKFDLMLQMGLPSVRIKEIALEKKVDLIVMGITGAGPVERTLFGSNAERLLRKAPCKVLLVPSNAKFDGLKRIVYATDMTDENLDHAKTVVNFANIFKSQLFFLHVNSFLEHFGHKVEFESLEKKIKSTKYPKATGSIVTNENVQEGINNFLKSNKADCLALYTHHKNIMQRLFYPSVSSKMSLHAKIPLLIIHEKPYSKLSKK